MKKRTIKKIYRLARLLSVFLILGILAGAGLGYFLFKKYARDLPHLDSLHDYHPPVISEVFADDGTKIGEFWLERRVVLKQYEIPKLVEQAFVAGEDSSFFEHSGLDYFGILRAMIENIKAGHIVQGGSTITQQVVKTFILSKERKFERKIKEALLAKRLEERFSKQEILYLYLNQIYLGNRSYGIESAAQNYFRKSAKNLNIAEASMIAGLTKAPSSMDPLNNYPRAKERQEYIIDRLFDEDYITLEQREEAKNFELRLFKAPTDKEFNARIAPWFVEEVRRDLIERLGDDLLYTGGLKIYTTLQINAQKSADAAVIKGLDELHKRHGYFGPKEHLVPEQYQIFLDSTDLALAKDQLEPDVFYPNMNDDLLLAKPLKIYPNKKYRALVVDTNSKDKSVTVQVGRFRGQILPRDYGWARKRNNDAVGYNDTNYITDYKNTLKIGDIIEVKMAKTDGVFAKGKSPYLPQTKYFSLEETPTAEAAQIGYDLETGYVRSIVGGKDFTKSEFNRATQALRQTGSTFKPFLYTAAIDKGYTNESIIQDAPITIPDGPGRFWSPQNYGNKYNGPVTFSNALIQSLNVVSVRIILDIGTHYTTGLVRKLGIKTPVYKGYSMALGANDMKLIDVATAYGVFPTGGILPKLIFIKKVVDQNGKIWHENKPKVVTPFAKQIESGLYRPNDPDASPYNDDLLQQNAEWITNDKLKLTAREKALLYGSQIPQGYVLSPKTAWTMLGIMRDIVNRGTATRVKVLNRPVAGKTGTTNDQTDCWFIGYTPQHLSAVWTGHDQVTTKVGGGETGSKAAAPIFIYYMQNYLKDYPITDFAPPTPDMLDKIIISTQIPSDDSDEMDLQGAPNQNPATNDFFIDDL